MTIRFNEAAALHRGKRGGFMTLLSAPFGFNEAAALHRGKLRLRTHRNTGGSRFNEAAALHRGKRSIGILLMDQGERLQ